MAVTSSMKNKDSINNTTTNANANDSVTVHNKTNGKSDRIGEDADIRTAIMHVSWVKSHWYFQVQKKSKLSKLQLTQTVDLTEHEQWDYSKLKSKAHLNNSSYIHKNDEDDDDDVADVFLSDDYDDLLTLHESELMSTSSRDI